MEMKKGKAVLTIKFKGEGKPGPEVELFFDTIEEANEVRKAIFLNPFNISWAMTENPESYEERTTL